MQRTLITILTLGFLSCNNSTDKKRVEKKWVMDTLNSAVKKHIDENNCNFNSFLNDPKIPKLAKDLLNNTVKYSEEPLSYFENLKSTDKQTRSFYFKAITNSYKISDAGYAEGLAYNGHEYVENNTPTFASYFEDAECFTINDLTTWTDIVMMEFMIDDENTTSIIDSYIKKLKSNCQNCTTKQKETINKFGKILKEKWVEYSKNSDLEEI